MATRPGNDLSRHVSRSKTTLLGVLTLVLILAATSSFAPSAHAADPEPTSAPPPSVETHVPPSGDPDHESAGGTSAVQGQEPASETLTATDTLQLLTDFNLRGGYVAAGVGMRNRGFGTISVSGIPAGSTIQAAYLFWVILGAGPGPLYTQGSINGTSITGTFIGQADDPCWGNAASFAYRADVLALVSGNGSYDLTGFRREQSMAVIRQARLRRWPKAPPWWSFTRTTRAKIPKP